MLTCKERGGSNFNLLFPVKIDQSALLESGYTSTGAVATDCTIAVGFKPTAATTAPLNDVTNHYLLTIQKQGVTVKVWKQGVQLPDYAGSVGATYAEFLSNVLTAYCGNDKGYYSRLVVAEHVLTCFDYWEPAAIVTGLWRPRSLGGLTIHTHLDFADAANLGADVSGNGNDWAMSGSMSLDVPTNNYATLNPLLADPDGYASFSNGNNTVSLVTLGVTVASTLSLPSKGKWYAEYAIDDSSMWHHVGITNGLGKTYDAGWKNVLLYDLGTGKKVSEAGGEEAYGATCTSGDVIGIAVDMDSGEIEFFRNNLSQGVAFTTVNVVEPKEGWFFSVTGNGGTSRVGTYHFGASGFKYTPPTGYKSLCQANKPLPVNMKSSAAADIVLRNGTAGSVIAGITPTTTSGTKGGAVANLTDGSASTWWQSNTLETALLQVTLPTAKYIDTYELGAESGTYAVTAPRSWTLKGSSDGAEWTTIDAKTGVAGFSGATRKRFSMDAPGTYKHLQLHITETSDTSQNRLPALSEWTLSRATTGIETPDMAGGADCILGKNRDAVAPWILCDKARPGKYLSTDSDQYELSSDTVYSFPGGDRYAVGGSTAINGLNQSILDCCLKADAIIELASDGSVVSQDVRGTSYGFQIHKLALAADLQIPNHLGKPVAFALLKRLDTAQDWWVFHKDLPSDKFLNLNTPTIGSFSPGATFFDKNTSTTLELGSWVGTSGDFVLYTWADSDFYKAFSFKGNYSSDGPYVGVGKVLSIPFMKNADEAYQWYNYDNVRCPFNPIDKYLLPSLNNAEGAATDFHLTSAGFKISRAAQSINNAGKLVVGLAIKESEISNAV